MPDLPISENHSAEFAALEAVINSNEFRNADQMRRLLEHIVRVSVNGNKKSLMAKNIAIDVYGAPPADLDDLSAIRTELGRLRRRLHRYYSGEGASDPVLIDIPKGAYVANFERRVAPEILGANLTGDIVEEPSLRQRVFGPSWLWVALAAVIGLFALTAVSRFDAPSPTSMPRLVVAPVAALSDNPETTRFAQGLTADIVNRLARFPHMILVSRQSVAKAYRAEVKPEALADTLSADYQLNGVIHASPADARFSVELLRTSSRDVVWVEDYALPSDDSNLFDMQLNIANEVSKLLAGRTGSIPRLELSDSEASAKRPAYICVLNYYAYLANRSPAGHLDARTCLEEATIASPGYAEVWTSLANIYLDEKRNRFNPMEGDDDALDRARAVALKGVELGPDSASAYSVLAAVEYFRNDMDAFRAAAGRALKANPNDVDALAYMGHLLSVSGSWDEGQSLLDRAKEMSPVHPPLWHHASAMAAMREGDYERAVVEAELGEMSQLFLSYMTLSAAYAFAKEKEAAAKAFRRLEELRPGYIEDIQGDLQTRNFSPDIITKLAKGVHAAAAFARTEGED